MEAANHSKNSAMEVENHVKYETSSKSPTSSGNFELKRLLKFCILVFAIGFVFVGCIDLPPEEEIPEVPNVTNFDDEFTYNPNELDLELAKKCALYSALAYQETRFMKNLVKPTSKSHFKEFLDNYSYVPRNIESLYGYTFYYSPKGGDKYVENNTPVVLHTHLKWEGFEDIDSKNHGNEKGYEDGISYTLAYKGVNGGEILLVVVLRGTDREEWRGNMDIWGKDGSSQSPRHFSWETANKMLQGEINKYVTNNGLDKYPINLLITGHSRGAAVANLLAVDSNTKNWCSGIKNVYSYTFATPNNTTSFTEYRNIFNFCFDDDFVPQVPLDTNFSGWKYGKSGINYHACAEDLYNKNVNGFQRLADEYLNVSEGRKASLTATQEVLDVLQDFAGIAPTVNVYYTKLLAMAPTDGWLWEEKKTLHGFMRDYIANAAINTFGAGVGSALKQIPFGNDVHKIADFFVDGITMKKSINDTHQALTYYYALLSGNDNFKLVENNNDNVDEIVGVWDGWYCCGTVTLTINNNMTGVFDFVHSSGRSGSYKVSVECSNGVYNVKGKEWIVRPPAGLFEYWYFVDLIGGVISNGIFHGTDFELERVK